MNPEGVEFILNIAEELRRKSVRFFFLDERWKDEGKDIDLCVHREDLKKFHEVVTKNGFRFLSKFPPWKRFYVTYKAGDIILLDVHVGRYEGVSEDILGFGEGYWLDPTKQVFYYIYRISLGEPHTKYTRYLKELVPLVDFDRLEEYLSMYFKNSEKIVEKLKAEKFEEIKPEHRLRHTIVRVLYYSRNTLFRLLRFLWKLINPNPHVVFLGPNGSGKTTLAKLLVEVAKKGKFTPYYEYGGRYTFRCLKPINWLKERVKKRKRGEGNKKAGGKEIIKYNSSILPTVLPIIYYVEYFLRTLCLYPKRLHYKLVITDRWFYDLITSPNASKGITKLLSRLLPKPTIVVYVYNDLEVLHARRPEIPVEVLEEQLKSFEEISELFDVRVKSDSKEKALEEVTEAILEKGLH